MNQSTNAPRVKSTMALYQMMLAMALITLGGEHVALADSNLVPAPVAIPSALARLEVYPADMNLSSSRDRQSIVVQAIYADGITRDVTAQATIAHPGRPSQSMGGTPTRPSRWLKRP